MSVTTPECLCKGRTRRSNQPSHNWSVKVVHVQCGNYCQMSLVITVLFFRVLCKPVFDLVKTQVLIGSMYERQVTYEQVNVPTNLCQCSECSFSHFPLSFLPCQCCRLLIDLFMVLIYQFWKSNINNANTYHMYILLQSFPHTHKLFMNDVAILEIVSYKKAPVLDPSFLKQNMTLLCCICGSDVCHVFVFFCV
jgi:hypothetical protein